MTSKSTFDPKRIGKPPEGYIPGLWRGDHGFITRIDRGPMMNDAAMGLNIARLQAQQQQRKSKRAEEGSEAVNYNDSKFDNWNGIEDDPNLLKIKEYDNEDKEADEVYDMIDKYVEGKKGAEREKNVQLELLKIKRANPTPKEQIKEVLSEVRKSMRPDDWLNIPEIGDYKHRKSKREDKYTPVPDNVILEMLDKNKLSGVAHHANPAQSSLNVVRDRVLQVNLDMQSKSVLNQSVLDKSGYITQLQQGMEGLDINFQDLGKARLLIQSMVKSDPKVARGWIAAARVEELDGKASNARSLLSQALEHCPDSEDLYFEAARLEPIERKKALLARALKIIPKSVKLWLAAADAEEDIERQKKVLNKSLMYIPQSEKIWRKLISLCKEDDEAKMTMKHAIEVLPDDIEIHLAYAKLHSYEEAKKILNDANKHFKNRERAIWIYAARLEEANGSGSNCEPIISRAIKKISKIHKILKREEWMHDAEKCESGGSIETAKAIIKAVMMLDMKEKKFIEQWIEDASLSLKRGRIETTRAIYNTSVSLAPDQEQLWLKTLEFERVYGDEERYIDTLNKAIEHNKDSQVFWMKIITTYIRKHDVDKARESITKAIALNPGNDKLIIAKAEMEKQLRDYGAARKVLENGRNELNTIAIWRSSITTELQLSNSNNALELAKEAVRAFPGEPDLLCDLADVYAEMRQRDAARSILGSILRSKELSTTDRAWISMIDLTYSTQGIQIV